MTTATGSLISELNCIFGTGKSFLREEPSTLPIGTEINSRFDSDGWHKFTITEYGRTATYAVRNAKILDTALGLEAAPTTRDLAIAEIKRLMATHGITAADFA